VWKYGGSMIERNKKGQFIKGCKILEEWKAKMKSNFLIEQEIKSGASYTGGKIK